MQVNRVKIGLGPVPRGPKATNKRKLCAKQGCLKQARDGSSHCISHGGGRRCEVPSCTKSAVGSSDRCKAHGGGRRCTVDGCTTAARPGPRQLCQKHGGREPRRARGRGKRSEAGGRRREGKHEHLESGQGRGRNSFKFACEGKTTIYDHPPSGFQSAEGPTRDFEAEFKSVNPFHHLKKKALSYLTPTIHCKKLFGAVMSTPRRNYKKGVEGFLQFLRDTHDERLRKIHAWIP
ncbi:hypothetical protein FOZ63_003712 [Perkinsus olseni]|uniref:WRKY19-like zinc finger domain-containing protein n=1 Tax=Perkinsus olseni TaxID=32597 RepID=A0A7J6UQ30_PEROL|nr:hypothetical protein FOZ63_003712 [Perkinsus olseni]